jgi:hypothetical protein
MTWWWFVNRAETCRHIRRYIKSVVLDVYCCTIYCKRMYGTRVKLLVAVRNFSNASRNCMWSCISGVNLQFIWRVNESCLGRLCKLRLTVHGTAFRGMSKTGSVGVRGIGDVRSYVSGSAFNTHTHTHKQTNPVCVCMCFNKSRLSDLRNSGQNIQF